MNKLKPCPFCGGIPKRYKIKNDFFDTEYVVFCQNCRCSTEYETVQAEADKKWNRRIKECR